MSIQLIASGQNNQIAYTTNNGANWTNASNATSIFNNPVYCVAHNGVIWVGVSESGGAAKVGYSSDGITWTASTSGNSFFTSCVSVAYADGKFVAVGYGPSRNTIYSTDGINWTGGGNASLFGSAGVDYGACVVYRNSTWVAGGAGGSTGVSKIAYSTDGITWTKATGSNTTLLSSIFGIDFNGTRWVAVGANSNNTKGLIYSTDLNNWTDSNQTFGTVGRAIRWGNGKFIAVGQNNSGGVQFKTSADGISWTSSSPANCVNPMTAVEYLPDTSTWFIGQGGSSPIIRSTDNGVTWSTTTSSIAFVRGFALSRPPPYVIGTAPTINSITNLSPTSFAINFTSGTGGLPTPTTYFYSLNAGSNYTNANSTTSPITITGLDSGVNYRVQLIANNLAGNTVASNVVTGFIPYPCFLQGTKILRMNQETDEEEYVPVESLRRGDLIKTYNHGYKAIEIIGFRDIERPLDISKLSSRLYWLRKSTISGMKEDLCVTGDHCILHKTITDKKRNEVLGYMGDIYVTEDHYRVPAFLDDRAEPYKNGDKATIWHFALENSNMFHNYGVFANGLLVESSSLHYMYKYSNMKLL